jgi:hypothetical protein
VTVVSSVTVYAHGDRAVRHSSAVITATRASDTGTGVTGSGDTNSYVA